MKVDSTLQWEYGTLYLYLFQCSTGLTNRLDFGISREHHVVDLAETTDDVGAGARRVVLDIDTGRRSIQSVN